QSVCLFDVETARELAVLPASRLISQASFSPDGTQLLITYETAFAHLWDLRLIRRELAEMNLDWDEPPFARSRVPDPTIQPFNDSRIEITVMTNEAHLVKGSVA